MKTCPLESRTPLIGKSRQEKNLVWKFVTALKQCRDLEQGKRLHLQLASLACHSNKHVTTALIIMYGKCGDMQSARKVFDKFPAPATIAWNCLMLGYVENGESLTALSLFHSMSCDRDSVTFLAALKACSSLAAKNKAVCLENGQAIHKKVKEHGLGAEITLINSLVDMYGKYGDMDRAKVVFDESPNRNVVTWNSLMLGYVNNGNCIYALEMFCLMDCKPDDVSFLAGLKACAGLGDELGLEKGRSIHKQVDEYGLSGHTVLENTLLDMYCKCGCVQSAKAVFERMKRKTVVSWNCLIYGHVENGESSLALKLYGSMDCQPDSITFVAALRACSCLAGEENQAALEKGMAIHEKVKELKMGSDLAILNSLLNMYGKYGYMERAQGLFNEAVRQETVNTVTWNCLILGYVGNGEHTLALELYKSVNNCQPDSVTFLAGLKACSGLAEDNQELCLSTATLIHNQVKALGLDTQRTPLTNTLMSLYMRCRAVQSAQGVFDTLTNPDVVSWTCMVLGYVENGQSSVALEMFFSMECEPDLASYAAGLKACIGVLLEDGSRKGYCLERGMEIHQRLRERSLDSEMTVGTRLVDMYCRAGNLSHAREVFDRMERRDAVSWTCLILGYVECGESSQAIDLFMRIDCELDSDVFIAVLGACGALVSVTLGRFVHAEICKVGLEQEGKVSSCLVDFYGKCGKMCLAEQVFYLSVNAASDVVSWNGLLAGYTTVGDVHRVLKIGAEMEEEGVEMNEASFTCMLTACSHRGVVEDGKRCFQRMLKGGIRPRVEHYNCMVDMLGRSNMVEEALKLVSEMPFQGDKVTWTSLLESCRKWNNFDVGRVAFASLKRLNEN